MPKFMPCHVLGYVTDFTFWGRSGFVYSQGNFSIDNSYTYVLIVLVTLSEVMLNFPNKLITLYYFEIVSFILYLIYIPAEQ